MKNKVNRYEHRAVALCILLLCLSAGAMSGCSTLPPLENRALSTVVFDTGTTRLGKAITPLVEAHPGKSGLYPLPDARDAFAARSLLARAAERTLDLQYYIWHGDMSGDLALRGGSPGSQPRRPSAAIVKPARENLFRRSGARFHRLVPFRSTFS
jgi:hypothetical protein